MKQVIALLMCAMMLFACACSSNAKADDGSAKDNAAAATTAPNATAAPTATAAAATADPTVTITPAPNSEQDQDIPEIEDETIDDPIAEYGYSDYGEVTELDDNVDGYTAYVYYPSGFPTLDSVLWSWCTETMTYYSNTAKFLPKNSDGSRGLLYIDYNSFEYADHYVSVQFYGTFQASVSGISEAVIATFIYDSDTDQLLSLSDVFTEDQIAYMKKIVELDIKGQGVDPANVNTGLLDYVVLTDFGAMACNLVGTKLLTSSVSYEDMPITTPTPLPTATPTATPTAAPTETPVVKPTKTTEAWITRNGVNIRPEPNTNCTAFTKFNKGTKIAVVSLDYVKGWTQIWYNDGYAYVASSYVTFTEPTPEVVAYGYVSGNSVYVRSAPNTSSDKMGLAHRGDKLSITCKEYTKGWDQILYNGAICYISSKYVSNKAPATPTPVPTAKPTATPSPEKTPYPETDEPFTFSYEGYITTNNVYARAYPNNSAPYYAVLTKLMHVLVMEQNAVDGWDYVFVPTTSDGTKGYYCYVLAKYVDSAEPIIGGGV